MAGAMTPGRLWWRWVGLTTAGEVAGFCAPAVVGAVTSAARVPDAPAAALLVAAGAVEGALLGWSQSVVLRRAVPALPGRDWVRATSLGAVVAWTMGMLPTVVFARLSGVPTAVLVVLAVAAGLVLLGSIGTAQWLVLRRYRPRCGYWVAVTAGAWCLGLGLFLAITMPLWHPGQPVAVVVLIGVLGAIAMAVTAAAFTGAFVVRLARPFPPAAQPVPVAAVPGG